MGFLAESLPVSVFILIEQWMRELESVSSVKGIINVYSNVSTCLNSISASNASQAYFPLSSSPFCL